MLKGKEEEGENKPERVSGRQRFLHGNNFWNWNDNEVKENGFSLETSMERLERTRSPRVI
ncbi:hypothetical protein L195_g057436 [Trifolium pratense]|uniref:Uncharacterized protein n=1 Tax=Trifolium pratense TaxID=57577 RepID=A0A2K3KHK6_TRIPR|nr:hypothetical protein L195_g062755 [Trifolium pratense]PNX70481.1 hypothetical protein L195_g057436 [Trifolium pratense]